MRDYEMMDWPWEAGIVQYVDNVHAMTYATLNKA